MTRDLIIGLDAGTSIIKAVAFDLSGQQVAVASRPNHYATLPNGGVEQDMARTHLDAVATLKELTERVGAERILALAVTGQGDGTWLIDKDGDPVHDGWLWLDGRAADVTADLAASPAAAAIYDITATGLNVCQMRTQLLHMQKNDPGLLARAATAFHCKDWLYFKLTGERATDPAEGFYTFGNYLGRCYSEAVIDALGLRDQRHLIPPVVDGAQTSHPLTAAAAAATGLPEGLPVVLAYLDIMCSALGAGLYDPQTLPGLTVLGSTGIHMRFAPTKYDVVLNADRSGYTMPFPGSAMAQLQTNMAATLNIDWMLDCAIELLGAQGVERPRADLLKGLDERVLAARPGAAIYHPYISTSGERGPFAEPKARASFTGLDRTVTWFEMMRAVFEGLAFAARDCYAVMGKVPPEIRLAGGASRSAALRAIFSATMGVPIRTVAQVEAGAAGAAMTAAIQQGLYADAAACVDAWVNPLLQETEAPDSALTAIYDPLFESYVKTRQAIAPAWQDQAHARNAIAALGTAQTPSHQGAAAS